jgi:hypothetical protein
MFFFRNFILLLAILNARPCGFTFMIILYAMLRMLKKVKKIIVFFIALEFQSKLKDSCYNDRYLKKEVVILRFSAFILVIFFKKSI